MKHPDLDAAVAHDVGVGRAPAPRLVCRERDRERERERCVYVCVCVCVRVRVRRHVCCCWCVRVLLKRKSVKGERKGERQGGGEGGREGRREEGGSERDRQTRTNEVLDNLIPVLALQRHGLERDRKVLGNRGCIFPILLPRALPQVRQLMLEPDFEVEGRYLEAQVLERGSTMATEESTPPDSSMATSSPRPPHAHAPDMAFDADMSPTTAPSPPVRPPLDWRSRRRRPQPARPRPHAPRSRAPPASG